MIFNVTLYFSLGICLLGLLYRIWRWFGLSMGPDVEGESATSRFSAACRSVGRSLISLRVFLFVKVVIWDILLQARLCKTNIARWLFHMLLFYAFLLLVFVHALDENITQVLFPDYASTLDPYLFLRNFLGMLVIAGGLFFIFRRVWKKPFHKATNRTDMVAMVLLFSILVSGFLLEAVQIFSSPIFDQMVEDYMGPDDPEEVVPLKAYWAKEFGVVFPEEVDIGQPEILLEGRDLHEENCAACHSRPTAAFASYPLSVGLRSFAGTLNQIRADLWLWYVHFLVCFMGLAYLPFSKFFHLISVPLNLMVQSGKEPVTKEQNKSVRRIIGMDACTHCGVCSLHCSVMPIYRLTANPNVLPSEKLISVQRIASGKKPDPSEFLSLADGSFACTDCYRCTNLCPSGIQLHDLWQASRKELEQRNYAEPTQWIRERSASQWASGLEKCDSLDIRDPDEYLLRNINPETFSACVQCTVCANVCPVVSVSGSLPSPEVTPQQVMNLLRLDLRELAMGSRMVWDCMTCYMCQEHCPQGIRVADILYELRNMGANRLSKVRFATSVEPENDSGMDAVPKGN